VHIHYMAFNHDKRYKRIFSNPYFLQKLLESFVNEDFISKLDFTTLKRLDKSFISKEFRRKESDLIFSVNFKNTPVYIFLLIEFQSTVDKLMPVRFLRYITELYETFHGKTKSGKLPAVFPVLLYSGDPKWTAKTEIWEIIEKTVPAKYIPVFSYYPVLENEISKESLLKIKNAVSAIFYIENSDPEKIQTELDKIIEIIKDEKPNVINEFSNWLNNYLGSLSGRTGKDTISLKIEDVMEVKSMFATRMKAYGKKLIEQGIEQGVEQEKRTIILNMDQQGLVPEKIAELTGLGIDEVRKYLEK
jgi:predicted transposase/invertase (TIGR01784 family)